MDLCGTAPRELLDQSSLVPDSLNWQGIDSKDSEEQHSETKDDVRSMSDESSEDCQFR